MKKFILLFLVFLFVFNTQAGKKQQKFIPKSDLVKKVLITLKNKYVNVNRIHPQEMLQKAVENLSLQLPPVLAEYQNKKDGIHINILVDTNSANFIVNKLNNLDDLEAILQQIMQFVKINIKEKNFKDKEVEYILINGLLKTLDPHTLLLSPKYYESFSTDTQGSFGGVGITIQLLDNQLTITSPIKDTPASKVGLLAKDRIVQINDESTVNMSLQDAIDILRGKKGDPVDIFILREGLTTPKKYTVIRDTIKLPSVSGTDFQENNKRIGYIQITRFIRNTYDELNDIINDLDINLNDFKGLIIDVRDNPGGFLNQAIQVSDRFLEDGVIVSTTISGKQTNDYKARCCNAIIDQPIIVLTNKNSASASEILSAAIKNNKRGIIIGDYTFGKGSVQSLFNQRDGSALKLTTSQYLTPGRQSIQLVGVAPDVHTVPYFVSENFFRYYLPENRTGEDRLEKNIAEWSGELKLPETSLFYLFQEKKPTERANYVNGINVESLKQDYVFQVAKNILFQFENTTYSTLLENAKRYAKTENVSQKQELKNALKKFNIQWNELVEGTEKKIQARVWIEKKDKDTTADTWKEVDSTKLKADNSYRLYIEAKNTSHSNLQQIIAILKSKNNLFNKRQLVFGDLKPQNSKKWYIPFALHKSTIQNEIAIDIQFVDQKKKVIHTDSEVIKIIPIEPTQYSYNIIITDTATQDYPNNDNQIIEEGELLSFNISIKNESNTPAKDINVAIKNGEKHRIYLMSGRQDIKEILPQESQTVQLNLVIKEKPLDNFIDLALEVNDEIFHASSINQKLRIPFNKTINQLANASPTIEILNTKMKNDKLIVTGKISDDKQIKDYYILQNSKKVFYKNIEASNDIQKNLNFTIELDLVKGDNYISIITRDNENISSSKRFHLLKS